MSVNLNEFTAEQLEYAILVFKAQETDLNYKMSAIDFWDDSELKTESLKGLNKEFDTCILFRVQIMNALEQVRRKEKTISN